MSDHVGFWGKMAWQAMGPVVFSWMILNSVVLIWTMRDRLTERKHYQEFQG